VRSTASRSPRRSRPRDRVQRGASTRVSIRRLRRATQPAEWAPAASYSTSGVGALSRWLRSGAQHRVSKPPTLATPGRVQRGASPGVSIRRLRRATQPAEWRGARSCRAKRGCGFGSASLASGLAGAHRRQAIRGGMRRGTESAPPRSDARPVQRCAADLRTNSTVCALGDARDRARARHRRRAADPRTNSTVCALGDARDRARARHRRRAADYRRARRISRAGGRAPRAPRRRRP